MRSKRTKRSRGFAFIEFTHRDVAVVAADAMNGFQLGFRQLQCKVLKDHANWRLKGAGRKCKYIPWKVIARNRINKKKSKKELRQSVKNLLKNEQKKREKLRDLGIEYEY